MVRPSINSLLYTHDSAYWIVQDTNVLMTDNICKMLFNSEVVFKEIILYSYNLYSLGEICLKRKTLD